MGADTYQARLGNGWPLEVKPGDFIDVPGPNQRCDIAVRTVVQDQVSAWSNPLVTVTRPPAPDAPARAPFDLSAFGIVLEWRYKHVFRGHRETQLQLHRTPEGSVDGIIVSAVEKQGRFVDMTYPMNVDKLYHLVAVVPRGAVPDDLLAGPNSSFASPATKARGPHSAIPPGRIERSLSIERRKGQVMLTVYGYPSLRG